MIDTTENAVKLAKELRAMSLIDVANWIRKRRPRGKATQDQFAALAFLIVDLAHIDFVSRRPSPDHPYFQELKRRADAAHDLAMSYRRQIEQMKGKR
jgi:hypothetical protein